MVWEAGDACLGFNMKSTETDKEGNGFFFFLHSLTIIECFGQIYFLAFIFNSFCSIVCLRLEMWPHCLFRNHQLRSCFTAWAARAVQQAHFHRQLSHGSQSVFMTEFSFLLETPTINFWTREIPLFFGFCFQSQLRSKQWETPDHFFQVWEWEAFSLGLMPSFWTFWIVNRFLLLLLLIWHVLTEPKPVGLTLTM